MNNIARISAIAIAMAMTALASNAQKVQWHVTTEAKPWATTKSPKGAETPAENAQLLVVTGDSAQVIDGIGGTFNEIGWDMLCQIPEEAKNQILKDLFSPEGSNFNYCRMPIGASDYAMNFYSLNDVIDDFEMINFSIDRDRHILMRYIKEAKAFRPDLKIWASPWSPPGWMKTNNHYASSYDKSTPNHNGLPRDKELELPTTGFKMQYGYLKAYALYFTKFVQEYGKEGIHIENICIQNEPCSNHIFPSCNWRPEDMAYFVGNFLGPKFEEEGIDTEIIFGTINRDNPEFSRIALNDPKAKRYFKGAGYQWDGKGAIPYINKEYPHLKMMHTEAECGNGSNDWGAAEHTWWQISHYLRNGARCFTYWNMVLDDTGVSPWGWKQNSLISVNPKTKEVVYHPEFYLMRHLAHNVQPGAYRLVIGDNSEADALAVRNPDGTIAVIAVNRQNEPKTVAIQVEGKVLNIELQPTSFNTLQFGENPLSKTYKN